ncbi:LacI family DNA-binding transcriptional regulator [Paenibacillus naphthalenovorans]|nr:LacI family DNA-binding transcriptional regulator [Paenibacillus sp. JMULE4]
MSHITMKEIAGLAGVSAATVSRGLSHYILP